MTSARGSLQAGSVGEGVSREASDAGIRKKKAPRPAEMRMRTVQTLPWSREILESLVLRRRIVWGLHSRVYTGAEANAKICVKTLIIHHITLSKSFKKQQEELVWEAEGKETGSGWSPAGRDWARRVSPGHQDAGGRRASRACALLRRDGICVRGRVADLSVDSGRRRLALDSRCTCPAQTSQPPFPGDRSRS